MRAPYRIPIRWRIFTMLFGFGFVAYVQRESLTIAAVRMMPELQFTQLQIGWIEQAFVLGYAIFQLPGGILGQRWGARRTLAVMGLLAFLSTASTALAPELLLGAGLLVLLMALQLVLGVAQAATFPVSAGVFEAWFPQKRWALVQGLQTMGLGLGAAATPPLIACIMGMLGWQQALWWTSLPALLLIGLWAWYGRNRPSEHPSTTAPELAVVAEVAELSEGSFWAAAMTVGRSNTMIVGGLMNTGGNLGGIIGIPIVAAFSAHGAWNLAFLVGAGCALASAAAWLFIDASRSVATDPASVTT